MGFYEHEGIPEVMLSKISISFEWESSRPLTRNSFHKKIKFPSILMRNIKVQNQFFKKFTSCKWWIKGCGMGRWLVFVSPCFRENVVATCNIVSFFVSLDNLLQKNVIVLFLKSDFKLALIWKKAIFDLLFAFFSHQGKVTKIPYSIYLTHIHTHILLTLLTFFALSSFKKYEFIRYGFSLVWVLVLILIRAILEQSINNKMVSKI